MKKHEVLENIKLLSDTDYTRCMQCGRCTAACGVADRMDIVPSRIVWNLIRGDIDTLLAATSPWQCLSCFDCEARCPRGLSPAKIMEALRLTSIRKQDAEKLSPDDVAGFDPDMPQQALVAAFRKFNK
ncbi:MAG: 4Fe-4S dicluster domain-containing protein [Pyramidobacter sp.]|nr:4Fe-4S dicluster domain-containing protein [Pyramidobacter sp.]